MQVFAYLVGEAHIYLIQYFGNRFQRTNESMRLTDCYIVHLRTAQHTLTAATRSMLSLSLFGGDEVRLKGLLC